MSQFEPYVLYGTRMEKEFNVQSYRSEGGQRFYEQKDLDKFKTIKTLLYDQGFTIAGAKKQLKQVGNTIIASKRTTLDEKQDTQIHVWKEHLAYIKKKLLHLKRTL